MRTTGELFAIGSKCTQMAAMCSIAILTHPNLDTMWLEPERLQKLWISTALYIYTSHVPQAR